MWLLQYVSYFERSEKHAELVSVAGTYTMKQSFQIAIDGPVAAGKSTVAKKLAQALHFIYVDTGAMYRAVALVALRREVDVAQEEALVHLVTELSIDIHLPVGKEKDGRLSTVWVDGEDVSWKIRSESVSCVVAKVAALPRVREALVPKQQAIAGDRNVVMEGRDTTYVVLPQADLKIFLDASVEERIKRYYALLLSQKVSVSHGEAALWLKERDELDKNRAASPLKIVPGVWVLDSTHLTVDAVVSLIMKRVGELRNDYETGRREE